MARTTTMIPTLTMLLCSSAGTTAEAAELYLSNAWNDQDPAEIYEVELSGTSADLTYLLDAPFPRVDEVLVFDPGEATAPEIVASSQRLPYPLGNAAATWAASLGRGFILGGLGSNGEILDVVPGRSPLVRQGPPTAGKEGAAKRPAARRRRAADRGRRRR